MPTGVDGAGTGVPETLMVSLAGPVALPVSEGIEELSCSEVSGAALREVSTGNEALSLAAEVGTAEAELVGAAEVDAGAEEGAPAVAAQEQTDWAAGMTCTAVSIPQAEMTQL